MHKLQQRGLEVRRSWMSHTGVTVNVHAGMIGGGGEGCMVYVLVRRESGRYRGEGGGGYRDGREGVGYRYEEEMNNDNMKTDTL